MEREENKKERKKRNLERSRQPSVVAGTGEKRGRVKRVVVWWHGVDTMLVW